MEGVSPHFTGQTVVTREDYSVDIPLDFYIIFHPDADRSILPQAAMALAKFLSENYMLALDADDAILETDEEDF